MDRVIVEISRIVWGWPLIVALSGIGVFLSFRLKISQIFQLKTAVKYITLEKEDGNSIGDVSNFASFCTALSATIGTGNIVGVALAFALVMAMVGCDRVGDGSDNTDLIPRSVLLAKPDKFCVTMNYTGDKIAYLARKEGGIELRVEDLSGNLLRKFDVKEGREAYYYQWTTTGDHILIGQDENGDENCHVICLDVKNGTSKDLTPFPGTKSHLGGLSRKHPRDAIILSHKNNPQWWDAYRVDIITGKIDLIFKNTGYSSFYFDPDFNLRIVSKMTEDGSIEDYLLTNGRKELLRKIPFEDIQNTYFGYFDAENSETIYGVNSLGRDKSAVVSHNLRNKTSRILFESDLADVGVFTYDPNTGAPQAFSVDYLKPEVFAADKSIEKDIAYLKSQSDGKYFSISNRNYHDDSWLISYYSSNSRPKYYLYRRDPKKGEPISLKFLFFSQPALDQYKLREKIPVLIKSSDGLDLVCYLTKSQDFHLANPRKLVVYVHGGPSIRDGGDYYESDVQLLANRGYSVLQINYRGSTGFGKKFINAANLNLEKIRNDIIDGVNWAIENKIADKNYVAIMGGSFGGCEALEGLTYTPDVFCCAINAFGGSNLITFLETMPPEWQSTMEWCYKFFGDLRTEEGRRYLIENSPITYAQNIKKPLMIFQGKNDPRVHLSDTNQIVAALKKNGQPVVDVLYPDEGHGCHKEPNAKSYMAIIELFFAKIMGGRFEPIHPGELDGSSHQILEGKEILGL
ncbi:MAG: prolyl oligopeptidase family serine peptidase [Holosporaceae bacterium]|jgi:dipeptidyl aminopeptidase/acylaminoacyl peptidase|nr:prolyl oligopeptidase family serine peptidase [Holosporaceae bacterium]